MRRGLFYPELVLGASELSHSRRSELQQFFLELAHQRGFPLHVASLWNALYFGYDLDARGYGAETIDPRRIPARRMATRDWSLPIGGFVRVRTATQAGDLLAEVIYKEGAHPEVDDSFVPPPLSGAPASCDEQVAGQVVALVRERFVLDIGAFGSGANQITPEQYERLLTRARWMDQHGHLIIEAMYEPEDAELDDLDYYVAYLLREHHDGLLAFAFREAPDDEELREALVRSFEAVAELASGCRELSSWRGKYFFLREPFELRVENHDAHAVLGAADLHHLYCGLARTPNGARTSYAAIGPRIVDLLEAGGLDPQEEVHVRGPGYAAAVVQTNAYIARMLEREAPTGRLPSGVHLRLDDDWQGGGIWRAECAATPSLAVVPATLPLGLGYAASAPPVPVGRDDVEPLPVTTHGFRLALTGRDIERGLLRLPGQVAQSLAPDASFSVVVRHDGDRETHAGERQGNALTGIAWPLSFYPGIVCKCNVEAGGTRIIARTERYSAPYVIDGHELLFDTDLGVYWRETAARPLDREERRGAPSLRELLNRAFRGRGRQRDDGTRALTLTQLTRIVFGPAYRSEELRAVAQTLEQMELEREGSDYLWRPRVIHRLSVSDRTLLDALDETQPQRRFRGNVHRHWVPMYLRHMRQRRPDPRHVARYAEARQREGMYGILPEELPENYTWVRGHERGGSEEQLATASTTDTGEIV